MKNSFIKIKMNFNITIVNFSFSEIRFVPLINLKNKVQRIMFEKLDYQPYQTWGALVHILFRRLAVKNLWVNLSPHVLWG